MKWIWQSIPPAVTILPSAAIASVPGPMMRSEEHTSEFQSQFHLVCRLLLDAATTDIYTLSLHDALPIWRDRGRERAVRRAGAATHHRSDAAIERVIDLLRADEMDMAVDSACGDDLALSRDRLGARPNDEIGRAHV